MNDDQWASIVLAVVAGSEDSETAEQLLTNLIGVIRADKVRFVDVEDEPEAEPEDEPEEANEDEPDGPEDVDGREPAKRPASKRIVVAPVPVSPGRSKALEEDEVTDLRERHWINGQSYRDLSEEFHVSVTTVGKVLHRQHPYGDGPAVKGEPDTDPADEDDNEPESVEPEHTEPESVEQRELRHQARRDRAAAAADPGLHSDGGFTVRAS